MTRETGGPDTVGELLEALKLAREALHHHYVEWDGEPEDAVPLQLARAKCDAAISLAEASRDHGSSPVGDTQPEAEGAGSRAAPAMREVDEIVSEWLRVVAVCTLEGGIIRRPPISQTEIDAILALLSSVRNGG